MQGLEGRHSAEAWRGVGEVRVSRTTEAVCWGGDEDVGVVVT
jgi:hypothetical protein